MIKFWIGQAAERLRPLPNRLIVAFLACTTAWICIRVLLLRKTATHLVVSAFTALWTADIVAWHCVVSIKHGLTGWHVQYCNMSADHLCTVVDKVIDDTRITQRRNGSQTIVLALKRVFGNQYSVPPSFGEIEPEMCSNFRSYLFLMDQLEGSPV